jgi:hypothetical protein
LFSLHSLFFTDYTLRKLQTPSLFLPLLSPHSLHAEVASDPTAPARSTGAALPIGGIGTPPLLAPSSLERRHPPPRPARSNAAAHPTGGIAAAALPTGGIAVVALTHGVLLRTGVNAAVRTQNCLLHTREIAAARTREIAAALLKVIISSTNLRSSGAFR